MDSGEAKVRSWTIGGLILLGVLDVIVVAVMFCDFRHAAADKPVMDTLVKGLGIIGASAFFAYRVASGSLAASLSLTMEVTQHRTEDGVKAATTLIVERGDLYSVEIKEIYLQVNGGYRTGVPFKAAGRETYHLSPHERTQYGVWCSLEAGKENIVTAVVVYKQQYFPAPEAHAYASAIVYVKPHCKITAEAAPQT
ncbi:hypothetical protein [Caballeronia sp. BR00000012568055]|uniref:hypothetical protein n=1 Tax=Caballeronia sp. BR00000012568055 TaxID=2918761 RepID=UPI0023F9C53D|nr:hypothetical protein [Caballeronia sp. BR00000012568055]